MTQHSRHPLISCNQYVYHHSSIYFTLELNFEYIKPFTVNWSSWWNMSMWFAICATRTTAASRTLVSHWMCWVFPDYICVCVFYVLLTLLQKTIRFTGCRSGYSHISCQEMNTFLAMFWFQILLVFENGLILNFFKSSTTIFFFKYDPKTGIEHWNHASSKCCLFLFYITFNAF